MNPTTLGSFRILAVAATLVPLLLSGSTPAAAAHRGAYSMEVLVDGVPLREYAARGTRYVEARDGHEYSIRLRNHTAERVAVALSVDGLNSIDAKTTSARDASKWILRPHETITINGWQTSSSSARRFFFTSEERSYGAWLGKTRTLGTISAAFFRERHPRPAPIWKSSERNQDELKQREGAGAPAPSEPSRAPVPSEESASPQSSDRADAGRSMRESESKRTAGDSVAPLPEPSDDLAATGIGERYDHRVRRVRFDAADSPAAVLKTRYEYRDALVRLGVLPQPYAGWEDPLLRRERARGFEDTGFAPDPY
jgi:hypothetical protein